MIVDFVSGTIIAGNANGESRMILSHDLRFIFIKPTKVAGTSFEIALSKYCGPKDIITPISPNDEATRKSLGFRKAQKYRKGPGEYKAHDIAASLYHLRLAEKFYNHIPAAVLKALLPREVWEDYTKISIVRNPFDRVISMYYWDMKWRKIEGMEAIGFHKYLLREPNNIARNKNITHIEGREVVNFWIQYENMKNDIQELQSLLGLPGDVLEVMNSVNAKSHIRPKQATAARMFEDFEEGVQLINILCRDEIEKYGYKPQ